MTEQSCHLANKYENIVNLQGGGILGILLLLCKRAAYSWNNIAVFTQCYRFGFAWCHEATAKAIASRAKRCQSVYRGTQKANAWHSLNLFASGRLEPRSPSLYDMSRDQSLHQFRKSCDYRGPICCVHAYRYRMYHDVTSRTDWSHLRVRHTWSYTGLQIERPADSHVLQLPACGTAGKSVDVERERDLPVSSNCRWSNWCHSAAAS